MSSHVNALLPVVDVVDQKPFSFPVSETAAAVYGFGDRGPPVSSASSSSSVEVRATSGHSPFAAASPAPWHRLPQPPPKLSWYPTEASRFDTFDCKLRTTVDHSILPASVSASEAVHPSSYGYRTRGDDGLVNGGLFLSHASNGLPPAARNDSLLPASCYLSNAGKFHHTVGCIKTRRERRN